MLAYAVSHTDVRLYLKGLAEEKKKNIYKKCFRCPLAVRGITAQPHLLECCNTKQSLWTREVLFQEKKNVLIILYYHFKRVAHNDNPFPYVLIGHMVITD